MDYHGMTFNRINAISSKCRARREKSNYEVPQRRIKRTETGCINCACEKQNADTF